MFWSNKIKKRGIPATIVVVVFGIMYLIFNWNVEVCLYNEEWTDGKTLENVLENPKLSSHDGSNNIFFHETSCRKDGIIGLNSRQSCAIESTG